MRLNIPSARRKKARFNSYIVANILDRTPLHKNGHIYVCLLKRGL
uniref:Uncharacterized protein n=1 Tax=Anguilla anguilla TaxID=7936 RepID=A0A0E9PM34_ANGAN